VWSRLFLASLSATPFNSRLDFPFSCGSGSLFFGIHVVSVAGTPWFPTPETSAVSRTFSGVSFPYAADSFRFGRIFDRHVLYATKGILDPQTASHGCGKLYAQLFRGLLAEGRLSIDLPFWINSLELLVRVQVRRSPRHRPPSPN